MHIFDCKFFMLDILSQRYYTRNIHGSYTCCHRNANVAAHIVLCYNIQYLFLIQGGLMMTSIYSDIAVAAPQILFPIDIHDLSKWPVIACDQYTSEPEYWNTTEELTRGVPSTLHMILPEVYLESLSVDALDKKISDVNHAMLCYLSDGTLSALPEGFIVLDRATSLHPSRKGLLLAVDVEQYDFTPGNKSRIRATEGTVLSRIPPRVRIRRDAPLEVPHIMLLIDDPARTVIEPAIDTLRQQRAKPLYDVELMQDGGHVTGYHAEAGSIIAEGILKGLKGLIASSADGFLFAVGDGNHSLATAKAHWEAIRGSLPEDERKSHPARFALVEVVNIHDEGLDFEPIHRVVFGLTVEKFYASAGNYFADQGFHFVKEKDLLASEPWPDTTQYITMIAKNERHTVILSQPKHSLAVGSLQAFLDHLVSVEPSIRIDYIHGEEAVNSLSTGDNAGFLLPAISKDSFFATISADGVFPRKTFSMGESFEKRYYMEAKRITTEV